MSRLISENSAIFRYYSFIILAVVVLFAMPLKLGLKIDAAIYSALARDVAVSGQFWPLHFPVLFPNFYEHPPFSIWVMSFFVKVFGVSNVAAALYSKLCALFTFCLLIFSINKILSKNGVNSNLSFLSGLLLLTWVPWLKYVADAQFEGPLSLALLSSFVWLLSIKDSHEFKLNNIIIGIAIGFFGFSSKGILFFPVTLAAFLWVFSNQRYRLLVPAFSQMFGYVSAIFVMLLLDKIHNTDWSSYYWSRALGWALQGQNQFDVSNTGTSLWQLLTGTMTTLKTELKMSVVWTVFLWITMLIFLYRFLAKKSFSKMMNYLKENSALTLAFIFYIAFMAPFCIAKIKMPHWPVPIYPVMVCFLLVFIGKYRFAAIINDFIAAHVVKIALTLAAALAIVPYPTESRWGRGEEWVFHKKAIQEQVSADNPLIIVTEELPLFMTYGYSHWFWGNAIPRVYKDFAETISKPCLAKQYLWLHPAVYSRNLDELGKRGWEPVPHQHRHVVLMECSY